MSFKNFLKEAKFQITNNDKKTLDRTVDFLMEDTGIVGLGYLIEEFSNKMIAQIDISQGDEVDKKLMKLGKRALKVSDSIKDADI